ncbi:glucosylglycerol 3-phosphatase [Abyssibacter sp.]|uniref:glucosylglycerol 3-phosphatase n=1 Tax=Abyssibacter sp. TaxID=2320200 RepID=UPI000C48AAD0|nr:glucosylglycerol 3-phosphatase [Xanthomonadales bacterium]
MSNPLPQYSLDATWFLEELAASDTLLIIQDLDGVCMGLVRDPLTRQLERRYIDAARRLDGAFYVLTNGEHIGRRGVNQLIHGALASETLAAEQGLYLPGLAAGGVQLQDRFGAVSHPGVSDAELAFLRAVPDQAEQFLIEMLTQAPFALPTDEAVALASTCVLDNPASPTVNLNPVHHRFVDTPDRYLHAQRRTAELIDRLLTTAAERGLADSFFVHYAPNLGRDACGDELVKFADGDNAGTTDFQFMLKGAIKEVGVLVILNHYAHRLTGHWPLGEGFNARDAPQDHDQLLALAQERFDPAWMPRMVGVGDTVTAYPQADGKQTRYQRGGSDRGFLTLVQALGERFGTDNAVVYVDSSAGEVRRPGVDAAGLQQAHGDRAVAVAAMRGISDPEDPLRPNLILPGGHTQYIDWFCALAAQRSR